MFIYLYIYIYIYIYIVYLKYIYIVYHNLHNGGSIPRIKSVTYRVIFHNLTITNIYSTRHL